MFLDHRRIGFRRLLIGLVTILVVLAKSEGVQAQAVPADSKVGPQRDVDWPSIETRIRDIYEKGRWRARRFNGRWLPDGRGYYVTNREAADRERVEVYDAASGESIEVAIPESPDPLVSPDGKWRIDNRGQRLALVSQSGGAPRVIAKGDEARELYFRSPTWSPDGTRLLFTEADETAIAKRAILVPTDPSFPEVRQNRFARVGAPIARLRVGVFDLTTDQLDWLPIECPDEGFYLGQVEWAGNSDEVLVETLSRFRDQRQFLLVDVGNQRLTTLFSETNDAWVDASQQKNLGLIWLRDGQQFIVISERDGWRHAYLYERDGRELAKLTPGDYDLIDRGVVDEAAGVFYFYASPENATQKYLYHVPLDGSGELVRVTPIDQPGTHDYDFSPDCRFAFHTYSRFDLPPVTDLVDLPNHQSIRMLEDNAQLHRQAAQQTANPTEFLQLEIGDGISLDAWLMKPSDFDPNQKYPIFVYVYGEPHSQTVLDGWATVHDQFHRVIADLGYLVLSIDNRGTPAPKGAAWRRSVFGSLGPLSTEEQAAALIELGRTRPYADLSRVGIWGWSGGGSNTLNALFRKPELYHVGIAVVPKPQPNLYNAWFQEIFMRTPAVNPDGYQTSAALNYAAGLAGKLLIVTGSGETNTHIQMIEDLVDRLIELGKTFDYMVYPNRDHGLQEGAGTVVHVRMRVIRYLVENLPRGGR